jgi:hypothetical protein
VSEGPDDDEEVPGSDGEPRPSAAPAVRPSAAPPPTSGLGRGRALRVLSMLAWLGLQSALVLTADRRSDGAFGFRALRESSTVKVAMAREVASPEGIARRVTVEGGAWEARDEAGVVRRFSWYDRVRRPELRLHDRDVPAAYGARAQVERLQAALDDVASHLEGDAETRRLLLDVTVRKNGREPQVHHLAATPRQHAPRGGR